jgi:hypothetical protein
MTTIEFVSAIALLSSVGSRLRAQPRDARVRRDSKSSIPLVVTVREALASAHYENSMR